MKLLSPVTLLVLVVASVCAVCSAVPVAFASEIVLQDPVVGEDYVSIPVTITTDGADQPASLQFDVTYDAANFAVLDVQVGDAAAQAGKSAVFNDSGNGTVTVLVAGLNQNVITDGVVANVSLCPLSQTVDTQTLFLDGVVVSDPFGNPIDVFYERPPEPEGMQLDDHSADETRFASEYALEAYETDMGSSNSGAMGSLEGTGPEATTAPENTAGATTDRASSSSQTAGYGRVTLIEPGGGKPGGETSTATRAISKGDATRQYGSQAYPGVPGDPRRLRYDAQQGSLDPISDGSRSPMSSRSTRGSVNGEPHPSGNQAEAIGGDDNTIPELLNRRAVTGYAVALVIVAGAVASRKLLVR